MSKQDLDYIELLHENRDAPPEVLHSYIHEFWTGASIDHLSGPTFRAKYLGVIPSRLPAGWIESPEISIQRVGLYTDTLLFVDIVGRILENRSRTISDEEQNFQLREAIKTMIELRVAARENVVGFLPTDQYLPPINPNTSIAEVLSITSGEQLINGMTSEVASQLNKEDQILLGPRGGVAVVDEIDRALLYQAKFNLVPYADEAMFRALRAKLDSDHRLLEDTANFHVLRRLNPDYFCRSVDAVIRLRADDKVPSVRRFFRKKMHEYFSDDIELRADQRAIDDFGRELLETFREAQDQLKEASRKLKRDLVADLGKGVVGFSASAICIQLDLGGSLAGLIPAAFGTLKSARVIDRVIEYLKERNDTRRKPAMLIGGGFHDKSN